MSFCFGEAGSGVRFRPAARVLVCLALLAFLAYLPELNLPFIADDYDQIEKGRSYGSVSGWPSLARDPLYRWRATSYLVTHWTERLLGLNPLIVNLTSLLFHILNTWLVFALGIWRPIGWRISAVAASFFAIYEGHHEAVSWYSALPELLVFFFTLSALLLWILWLQEPPRRFYFCAASLLCFLAALASKESSVVLVPLLVLALYTEKGQRWRLALVIPFAVLSLIYAGMIYVSRSEHLFFHDGTFSLQAPFLRTLLFSAGRMFWIWGLLSLAALAILGAQRWASLLKLACAWMAITLLPYCFLTYMPFVPSRHEYLSSAGLALVVAAGFLTVFERVRPKHLWIAGVLAAAILVHNCGYLWTKKHAQMRMRAAPTEALVDFARRADGPIYLHCFPYAPVLAGWAVDFWTAKPSSDVVWDPDLREVKAGSALFCWKHGLTTLRWNRRQEPKHSE